MQSNLIIVAIAFVFAIAILLMVILLGVGVAYREEIEKSRISFYARTIITPLLLLATVYWYLQGTLNSDVLFIAITSLLPILFCTDWGQLRRTSDSQE
jgi:hypothetical protein